MNRANLPQIQPRASYQGYPCVEAYWENSQGLEPGHGYVVMARTNFPRMVTGDPWAPLSASKSGGTTSLREGTDARGVNDVKNVAYSGTSIPVSGPLIFYDGTAERIVIPNAFIDVQGIEDELRSNTPARDDGTMRVWLMDIRGLWTTRGEIYGDYNVPIDIAGITVPKKTGAAPDPTKAIVYRERTVKRDGKPYTLLDLINLCLDHLPGGVTLGGAATASNLNSIIPLNLRWRYELPVKCLQHLLAAHNFHPVFDPTTNTLAIWPFNTGAPTYSEQGGVLRSLTMFTGATAIQIDPASVAPYAKRKTQHYYRPKTVRVAGQPIVRETIIYPLEAVGEVDGQTMPLAAAIDVVSDGKMTVDDLRRWVLMDPESKVAFKDGALTADQCADVERWAFKFFRIPSAQSGLLPILRHRARSMVDGARRPPLVWADIADEVRFEAFENYYEHLQANLQSIEAGHLRRVGAGPAVSEAFLEYINNGGSLNALKAAIKADKPSAYIEEIAKRTAQDDRRLLTEMLTTIGQIAVKMRALTAQNQLDRLITINKSLAPISPALYDVETDGVVKFHHVMGWVDFKTADGRDPRTLDGDDLARMGAIPKLSLSRLIGTPRVMLLAAYESTPEARAAVAAAAVTAAGSTSLRGDPIADDKLADAQDHYSFLGKADTAGNVTKLNPDGKEPADAAALFPRGVKTNLRQYIDIDGHTNVALLDEAAKIIVQQETQGEQQVTTIEGDSRKLYPIVPTGVVSHVIWSTGPDEAHTKWTSGVSKVVEAKAAAQYHPPGTFGLSTPPGSVLNPAVDRA